MSEPVPRVPVLGQDTARSRTLTRNQCSGNLPSRVAPPVPPSVMGRGVAPAAGTALRLRALDVTFAQLRTSVGLPVDPPRGQYLYLPV